jgi:dehydrogenase/reductase SDR family protein 7B
MRATMGHFAGKVVWITGASSGIGEALAYELARRGAKLVLSARRADLLEQVRSKCDHADQHMILPLDLTDAASLPSAAAEVIDRLGQIDVLLNNGGISQRGTASETILDVDRRIMEVNYMGTIGLTKAVLPGMLERGAGQIVVISSVAGKIGTPLRSAYAASKHALHGFFDSLRAEVHDRGVRVTVICPGFVKTEITVHSLRGDGSLYEQMDSAQAKAMSAEQFAYRAADAIARERAEVLIGGGKELFATQLFRFFPSAYNYLVRRVKST